MYKYYFYMTEKGPIYIVKEFEKVNGELFPKRMFEFYSHQPVEEYYNYLMFNQGNKYLRYGNFEIDNGDFITTNSQIAEINLFQLRCITDGYLREGVNPAEQTNKIIESGISKEEVDAILSKTYNTITEMNKAKIELEQNIAEARKIIKKYRKRKNITIPDEDEKRLNTFVSVFGDLFEEEETRY